MEPHTRVVIKVFHRLGFIQYTSEFGIELQESDAVLLTHPKVRQTYDQLVARFPGQPIAVERRDAS